MGGESRGWRVQGHPLLLVSQSQAEAQELGDVGRRVGEGGREGRAEEEGRIVLAR